MPITYIYTRICLRVKKENKKNMVSLNELV